MANDRIPANPYPAEPNDERARRAQRLTEGDLQIDPTLRDGPASTSRFVLFAVAAALVLGGVFYGLNNTSVQDAQTAPPMQTAQTQSTAPQGAPSGTREAAPRANTESGVTTGSAATNRPTAPQSGPTGTEVDRSNSSGKPE